MEAFHFLAQAGLLMEVILGLSALFLLTTVVYRIYLHPLAKYPGPKLFATTRLVATYYGIRHHRVYKVAELHNKYGPIVRVGPNEISYVKEEAWKDIYSSYKTTGQLGKNYHHAAPDTIFSDPNHTTHAQKRKILSPGFSDKAMRDREEIIQSYVSLVMQRLRETPTGEQTDLLKWFDCLGIDVVSRLSFGESFHALETSTVPEFVLRVEASLRRIDRNRYCNQWAVIKFFYRPIYRWFDPEQSFFRSSVSQMLSRRQANLEKLEKSSFPDYASILSKDFGTPRGLSPAAIAATATDIVTAGADTTASALSATVYYLLKNPSKLQNLTTEIRSTFKSEADITLPRVNSLKYQNAVISESMRLCPPGPETMRRVVNPGGNIICGDLIPAGTLVGVYHWAAGHHAASWKDVESFIPERWLGYEEYENDARGVISPFNSGPRNCVGQNLAMTEIRLTIARLFWNFDLGLCPESDNWTDMGAYTLIYHKRPLLVKVKSVER